MAKQTSIELLPGYIERLYQITATFEASEDSRHLKEIRAGAKSIIDLITEILVVNGEGDRKGQLNLLYIKITSVADQLSDDSFRKEYFKDDTQTLLNSVTDFLNLVEDSFGN